MKKALADSSYLVALVDEDHPRHHRVLRWQRRIVRGEWQGVLAAHSLAETYSVLTRIPHAPPISPAIAWQAIERNLVDFEVIALPPKEYTHVPSDLAARGIGGGPTYDALIAAVARGRQKWICCSFSNLATFVVLPLTLRIACVSLEESAHRSCGGLIERSRHFAPVQ
jgi:predicted nucleic acid-binding protein